MSETIEDRADAAANEVLTYFHNISTIGAFCGEATEENKRSFLRMCFFNFALREAALSCSDAWKERVRKALDKIESE